MCFALCLSVCLLLHAGKFLPLMFCVFQLPLSFFFYTYTVFWLLVAINYRHDLQHHRNQVLVKLKSIIIRTKQHRGIVNPWIFIKMFQKLTEFSEMWPKEMWICVRF